MTSGQRTPKVNRWVWDGANWVWPLPTPPPSPPPPRSGDELALSPGDSYEYGYDDLGLFDFHVEIDAWFAEHKHPGTVPAAPPKPMLSRATGTIRPASKPPAPPSPLHFPDGTAETRRRYPSQCRPLFPERTSSPEEKDYQEYIARAGRLGSFSSRFTLTIDGVSFMLSPAAIAPLNHYLLDWHARASEMAGHVPVHDVGMLVGCVRRVLEGAYRRVQAGEARIGQLIGVPGSLAPTEKPWWVRLIADGDKIRVTSLRWEFWPDHR